MTIFNFFRKYMGKMVGAGAEIFDKLEPETELKFLTSWSRSRTKMNRLRNTAFFLTLLRQLVTITLTIYCIQTILGQLKSADVFVEN
jgi:hypothetical protein